MMQSGTMRYPILALLMTLVCGCGESMNSQPQRREISAAVEELNFKQVALQFSMEGTLDGVFPPAAITDASGKPLLSWRVALLQQLNGGQELFSQFHLDEPWDSDHNKSLIERIPDCYRYAGDGVSGKTTVQLLRGPGTFFEMPEGKTVAQIQAVENNKGIITMVRTTPEQAVIWTEPIDFTYDTANPEKGLLVTGDAKIVVGTLGGLDSYLPERGSELINRFQSGGPILNP